MKQFGGPLALIENGDIIEHDVPNRSLNVNISDAEMTRRKSEWVAPVSKYERGYVSMFGKHVEQADKGCDFDF